MRRQLPVLRSWARGRCDGAAGFGVRKELVSALRDLRIFAPNALQTAALPEALAGHDIVVSAQTGSGKTLAFLLPVLQRLSEWNVAFDGSRLSRPDALVLAPSRELAVQISRVAAHLASALPSNPRVECVTSGAQFTPQRRALRDGDVRLLIATPERLLYHLTNDSVCVRGVRLVAIDEADVLLNAPSGIDKEARLLHSFCPCYHGAAITLAHPDRIICDVETPQDDHQPAAATAQVRLILDEVRRRPHRQRAQHILTAATIDEATEAEVRSLLPKAARVSHTGVLVPSLRQRFPFVRGDKGQAPTDSL